MVKINYKYVALMLMLHLIIPKQKQKSLVKFMLSPLTFGLQRLCAQRVKENRLLSGQESKYEQLKQELNVIRKLDTQNCKKLLKEQMEEIEEKEYQIQYPKHDMFFFRKNVLRQGNEPTCWAYGVAAAIWHAANRAKESDPAWKIPFASERDTVDTFIKFYVNSGEGRSIVETLEQWCKPIGLKFVENTRKQAINTISSEKWPIILACFMNKVHWAKFDKHFKGYKDSNDYMDSKLFEALPKPKNKETVKTIQNETGHAFVINGYNPFKKTWTLLDSWGFEFGNHGHCRLSLDCMADFDDVQKEIDDLKEDMEDLKKKASDNTKYEELIMTVENKDQKNIAVQTVPVKQVEGCRYYACLTPKEYEKENEALIN